MLRLLPLRLCFKLEARRVNEIGLCGSDRSEVSLYLRGRERDAWIGQENDATS